MKILAFAASNSRNSINRALVEYAVSNLLPKAGPQAEVEFLDLNDYEMPIYSIDRQQENGIPQQAQDFFNRIGRSDALLISFAEHNGFASAAWKNIFDWMSRIDIKVWQDKPMVILAATPGPRAGEGVLTTQEKAAPFFGGEVRGRLGIGNWSEVWDSRVNTLTRPQDIKALGEVLARLTASVGDEVSA